MIMMNSCGAPFRNKGSGLLHINFTDSKETLFNDDSSIDGGVWIESTFVDKEASLVFGYYHNEPSVCPGNRITAPRIGAVVSNTNGATWTDLGWVLLARNGSLNCSAVSIAGGNGDFVAVVDRAREYIYFFFGAYAGHPSEQGLAAARMRYSDRHAPSGKVMKWHESTWSQPGLYGLLTPFLPASGGVDLPAADFFWGPSIHWNTAIRSWVMLLNHCNSSYNTQSDAYHVSYGVELSNPMKTWSVPELLLQAVVPSMYPQVVGIHQGETDTELGSVARFFVRGMSRWEAVFTNVTVPQKTDDTHSNHHRLDTLSRLHDLYRRDVISATDYEITKDALLAQVREESSPLGGSVWSPAMKTIGTACKGCDWSQRDGPEKTLFEYAGQPGVITEQWYTGAMDENTQIRVYVDGEDTASLDFKL
jgi:hypothetical protein